MSGVNFRKTPPQPPKNWRQQFQRQWGRSRLCGDPMGRSQVRPSHIAPGSCIRSTTIIKSILCQMHHNNCLRCTTISKAILCQTHHYNCIRCTTTTIIKSRFSRRILVFLPLFARPLNHSCSQHQKHLRRSKETHSDASIFNH